MSISPVLDPSVINTLRQLTVPGEPDVLTEVLKLFLEEVPSRLTRLRIAWAAQNIEEVHRLAHSLKGSAGNIGAQRMFEICKQLDGIGRSSDVAQAGPLVDALNVEFANVDAEIRRLIGA